MSKALRACMLRETRFSELLRTLNTHLHDLESSVEGNATAKIHAMRRDISAALETESDEHFDHIFEAMHGGFLQRLAADFPTLTPAELRLSAFLRLPIPSKEVARLFSCSVRSVEKHRERMRKKFQLSPSQNLTTFLAARE